MKVNSENIGYVRHSFTPTKNKLLNKDSETESKFEKMLIDANIYFTREKGNYRIGTRWCYYDFFVPYWRMYFELDGHSHDSQEQKEVDLEKDSIIRNKQRFICRISNDYVLDNMEAIDFEIAKDLLKENNVPLSSAALNKILMKKGIIHEATRPSRDKNKPWKWKVLNDGYDCYGQNIQDPNFQSQTQIKWYVNRFMEMLEKLGVLEEQSLGF